MSTMSDLSTAATQSKRRSRPIRLSGKGAFLLLAVLLLTGAMLVQLYGAAVTPAVDTRFAVSMAALCASLFLVRALYADKNLFLFSPGFWLIVTVVFYFVLKALHLWANDAVTDTLVDVLWLTAVFLLAYCLSYVWVDRSLHVQSAAGQRRQDIIITRQGRWKLLTVYAAFKLFGLVLMASAGGGDVLEIAAATQNAGAGYIYRLPLVGNVIFLALLFDSFKNNRGWSVTAIALLMFMVEAVMSTSRLSIVLVVLWAAFLYHRYRHPISLLRITVVSLPLVLVVVLFGYARNVEVGSSDAYFQAAQILMDEPSLISDLFMQRLDMLPEMVQALDLYRGGELPSLSGGSYLYAFAHSIPRNIWESKPMLTAALVTSQTHPLAFADGVNIFPSIIIEGILNFSYPGVVLSGLLVGFLCRQFERVVESERLVPATWALAFFTFPMGLFNEGFHSNYLANMLYMTALMALLYKLLLMMGAIRRVSRRDTSTGRDCGSRTVP
jgi:oligosaccharide repeat unit polymerase